MRFPYQEIDEIEPDSDQHIQVAMPGGHHHSINPPVKPMLPSWPLVEGVLQIVVGLVTAGLGERFFHILINFPMHGRIQRGRQGVQTPWKITSA